MNLSQPCPELWGGVECTINRIGEQYHSQLHRSGHWERLEDLDRLAELGIRTLRFPLLWEALAPEHPGRIDWSWPDSRMERLKALGITPIIGMLHHGSGPRYTNLTDPSFPALLAAYARAVAERYPWVEAFTPVNEPLTTARFSGLYGHWYPHGKDVRCFCRTFLNQIRAIALAMQAIREVIPHARLVQTEDLGETFTTPALEDQAAFENERRWLTFDLLTGQLERGGRTHSYLRWGGISERELDEVLHHPCPPEVLGINHYVTSNRFLDERLERYPPEQWGGNGGQAYVDVEAVRVRAAGMGDIGSLLRQAWERFGSPIAITEAHLGCSREEQLRWLSEVWHAAREVRHDGIPVIAVTAWSLQGAYDWDSLLTVAPGHYEPGAFDLRAPVPRRTALAGLIHELSTTGATNNPLLALPGWWRRDIRLLPSERRKHQDHSHGDVPSVYAPQTRRIGCGTRSCPPLLIAGAAGMLGQSFARLCYLRGLPYRLLNRSEMDIADLHSVRAALSAFHPWGVINAAGFSRVDAAEDERERCWRENVIGPQSLAIACEERNVALVTFSSDLIFDGMKERAYLESDPAVPLNVYGESKAAADACVAEICSRALIARTGPLFDPSSEANFVSKTVRRIRKGMPVTVACDLWISPTYVPDLVHSTLDLLIDGAHGIWHLSTPGALTWADLARDIARRIYGDESLVHACPHLELGLKARRPRNATLGTERGSLMPGYSHAMDRYINELAAGESLAVIPCSGP